MKIAIGQLCSSVRVLKNAEIVNKLINKAVEEKAKILFLPEATDFIAKDAKQSKLLSKLSGEFLHLIQSELKRLNTSLCVSIGIHQPSPNSDRVLNSQIWLDQHSLKQNYRKLHLFDINIPNGPILQESKSVEPGKYLLKPFEGPEGFKIGFAICYDIRFPEMSMDLRKMGADIITFPSAFTTKTGEAHWKVLGQARAIETQTYVVMAAQCGKHDTETEQTKRISYGNSLIISPWGDILAEGKKFDDELILDLDGDYYEFISADIDMNYLNKIRQDMPILNHRREDIYNNPEATCEGYEY